MNHEDQISDRLIIHEQSSLADGHGEPAQPWSLGEPLEPWGLGLTLPRAPWPGQPRLAMSDAHQALRQYIVDWGLEKA